ncbi:MAG TPA: ComEC/Rec2 family competence protein [Solirubrobacteraceae bacterium]|jgi:competence protein ComEC|nr:ComEC/Rec2 family competence protein [Solirubrobacteraceae bacterium]
MTAAVRTAAGPGTAALRAAAELPARHPRHTVLAATVAGLLLGPRSPACVVAGALAIVLLARDALLALTAIVALLAGAAIAVARLAALDRTHLTPLLGREVDLRVTLLEHPRVRSFGTRVAPAVIRSGAGRGERVLVRAPSRVRWPAGVAPGAELAIGGRLAALGPFDVHERRRNAHALLRATTIRATGRRRAGLLGAIDAVRSRTERALTSGLPPPQGALARGMVLGQDGALTAGVREDFRVTGLSHLVAASGANVLLLATLVLAIATALGVGLSARLWLALALVAAYVPLAGAGPSIQRAGVMGAAGLLAALAGRPSSRWYALLLAGAATLGANPRAAEDPGWQLSFAAVLAMLALVPAMTAGLRRRRVPRGLAEALAVTAAATLGTAPLIALHFERLSLVSLPVNLLAAPAVAPVMWLGTIAGALGQVALSLAAPFAGIAALPLAYLTWLAERAAALPLAEVQLGSPGPVGVVAAYAAAGAGVIAWRRIAAARMRPEPSAAARTSRRACVTLLAIATVAAVVVAARPPAPPRDLTISFLDIGQGDATLIQHGRATVLVDTGPPDGPIVKRLRAAGVRRLDLLVATHAALDHDGAAAAVLDEIPVEMVLDGEEATASASPPATAAAATGGPAAVTGGPAAPNAASAPASVAAGPFGARAAEPIVSLATRRHVSRRPSDAGQLLRVGPLELRVLWPHRDPPAARGAEPNDRATVIHLRDGDFDMLLTADAESNVTSGLQLPAVDALKVAHHGSDDPGLPDLLRRLRPRVAVISCGARNLYGHPTPATVAALDAAVPIVRRTDRDGTVRLRVRDGRIRVEDAV